MNEKYNKAIGVITSLMNMNKKYYLSFTCEIYNEDLELFQIKLIQTLHLIGGKTFVHTISINWTSNIGEYQVWSNQINPYKNPEDPHSDYNNVNFDNHEKMCIYIYHLLELYSSRY